MMLAAGAWFLHHGPRRGRAHRHGHAESLQAVEGGRMRHAAGRRHAGGRLVGDRAERRRDVASLRVGRRLLERAQLVLARVVGLVLAREVEAAFAAVAVMGALVPAKMDSSVLVFSCRLALPFLRLRSLMLCLVCGGLD